MMQIVIGSDRVAVFFGDVGPIRLEADGCYIGPYFNPTHNSSNSELLDVDPPDILAPGIFKREGDEWIVIDQVAYEAAHIAFIKRHNAEATANRKAAYVAESDPLFFKYQRGECAKAEWTEKVKEIRERYPMLEDPTDYSYQIPVAEFT